MGGTTETTFAPEHSLTREQVCTVVARFAALEEISLLQVVEPDQFKDSLYIEICPQRGDRLPDGGDCQGI